jgi:hypothetical protein
VGFRGSPHVAYGLQAKTVASLGSEPLSSGVLAMVGLVQSGPRFAGATGTEIIASNAATRRNNTAR